MKWKAFFIIFKGLSLIKRIFLEGESPTLILFLLCSKCGGNDDKIGKEEKSFEILKILGLMNEKWIISLCKSNFKFDDTSLLDYSNSLPSKNMTDGNIKVCTALNYIENRHFFCYPWIFFRFCFLFVSWYSYR